ncbi:tRNA (guanosine(37)-N1)-methyltransferase TrmD [candidate division WOR-3 bacterium]|nr:tRNA (guanosine(37)-N1)-methyltransferase TrmD [candidate division WOR-3 bacterium]
MRINILTIFPEIFSGFISAGIVGRAVSKGLVEFKLVNIRDFATDHYGSVDDYPYGGGSGMVMRVDVVHRALSSIEEPGYRVLTSPKGEVFNQKMAEELKEKHTLTFICGRYKGIDARIEAFVDRVLSTGDFILSGGEVAAMTMVDAIVRLLPGVVGKEDSVNTDSFVSGLLEPPLFTRPGEYMGMKVPEVLLSGNHESIRRWRMKEALRLTMERRPELLDKLEMDEEMGRMLTELKKEKGDEGD